MKMKLRKLGILAMAITVMASCKKDQVIDNGEVIVPGNYENGYFVTNEGNFGTGNGSISFVTDEGTVENGVFESVNSFVLGDVVQSMSIINENAYVLVNGSSKIEVTSIADMKSIATIDVSSPRFMSKVSDAKAYVTDWGINGVQVIDLATNTVSTTIACGAGPEGITVSNGFAYVCNVGAWGLDSTVTIINTTTDSVETTLTVGDKPNSAVVDANGAVWVLTGGYTEYDAAWNIVSETAGNLVKIVDNTIENTYAFSVGNHPEDLVINDSGTTLYYSDGLWSKAVYAFDISGTELPTTALINKSFYGLGAHDGYVYGTDAVDFTQSGWSFKYSANGIIVDSVQLGIIPGGYCFN
jgi:YVTN family beta-propeller protein